jgi:hypothetical protein
MSEGGSKRPAVGFKKIYYDFFNRRNRKIDK